MVFSLGVMGSADGTRSEIGGGGGNMGKLWVVIVSIFCLSNSRSNNGCVKIFLKIYWKFRFRLFSR
jgi:hypothetical protein